MNNRIRYLLISVSSILVFYIVIGGLFGRADTSNEKAYRDLYNTIVGKIRDRSYGLADRFNLSAPADAGHYIWALSSWSIWPVYLGLTIAYALVLLSGLLT